MVVSELSAGVMRGRAHVTALAAAAHVRARFVVAYVVFMLRGDAAALPPLLLLLGAQNIKTSYSHAESYARRMNSGVEMRRREFRAHGRVNNPGEFMTRKRAQICPDVVECR